MTIERKHLIGIGAAILVAVAGGGAALAASDHHGSANEHRPGGPGLGAPPPGHGFGRGDRPGPAGGLDAASTYLGIPVRTLLADLQSGKTLAQVADATSGKSSAGLVAALVAAEKSRIQDAVAAGHLTQAQADRVESGLQARVQARVSGSFRAPGFGPPDGDRHGAGPGDDDGGDGGDDDGGGAPAPTTTVPPTHI